MDLGRRPEARFHTGPEYLSQKIISWQDIDYTTKRISKFSNDNRAGIERTLHRISCIRNRQSLISGLTCRVGRAIFGTINIIRDLLESGQSILILGRPGVGKTTIIREIARVLSDELEILLSKKDLDFIIFFSVEFKSLNFLFSTKILFIESVFNFFPKSKYLFIFEKIY